MSIPVLPHSALLPYRSPSHRAPPPAIYLKIPREFLDLLAQAYNDNPNQPSPLRICFNPQNFGSNGSPSVSFKIAKSVLNFKTFSSSEPSHVDIYKYIASTLHSSPPGPKFNLVGHVTTRLIVQVPNGDSQRLTTGLNTASNLNSPLSITSGSPLTPKSTLKHSTPKPTPKSTPGPSPTQAPTPKSTTTASNINTTTTSPITSTTSPITSTTTPTNSSSSNTVPGKVRTLAPISSVRPLVSYPLNSTPMRLLHLLASQPTTVTTMAQRTKVPAKDVRVFLTEYGKPVNNSNNISNDDSESDGDDTILYTLADKSYKDLRIWDWKLYNEGERTRIITAATAAFDRLEYPLDSVYRDKLIDPKVRKMRERQAVADKVQFDQDQLQQQQLQQNEELIQSQQQAKTKAKVKPSPPPVSTAVSSTASTSKRPGGALLTSTLSANKKAKKVSSQVKALLKPKSSAVAAASSGSSSTFQSNNRSQSIPLNMNNLATSPDNMNLSSSGSSESSVDSSPSSSCGSSPTSENKSSLRSTNLNNDNSNMSEIDLKRLAADFKLNYLKYQKLYTALANSDDDNKGKSQSSSTHKAQIKECLMLHHKLQKWKTILWQNEPANI